ARPRLPRWVGQQVCRRGSTLWAAIEIEAQPVSFDAAGTMLECLDTASNAKGAVVHIGAVGKVPDLLPRPPAQASAAVSVIAARHQPRLGGEPAQSAR